MGLLTILKKMKQKEKEVRLLMLYPQCDRCYFRCTVKCGMRNIDAE